jgi:hypothetical protein
MALGIGHVALVIIMHLLNRITIAMVDIVEDEDKNHNMLLIKKLYTAKSKHFDRLFVFIKKKPLHLLPKEIRR